VKVREAIEVLRAMNPEAIVYFDCPHCDRYNEMFLVEDAVVAKTRNKDAEADAAIAARSQK
jgi:hypothetical protein